MSLGNGAYKEGGATSAAEPKGKGIHYNPVRGNHLPSTVTLKRQWKHKYLPHTYHDKREGWAGNKSTVRTIRSESKLRMP